MLSPLKLLNSVRIAKQGDFIKYYEGCLATYANRGKRSIQEASYLLYEEGLVLLVAKRLGEGVYAYYAVRTKAPYTRHYRMLQILERLGRRP